MEASLSDSLATLEQLRSSILTQILELGDFRNGSITAIHGRCEKANCRCHPTRPARSRPQFPSADPEDQPGKSVSESFSSAVELRKAQRRVEALFIASRLLSQELLEVNEEICRARLAADTPSPEEKKRRTPSAKKSRAK